MSSVCSDDDNGVSHRTLFFSVYQPTCLAREAASTEGAVPSRLRVSSSAHGELAGPGRLQGQGGRRGPGKTALWPAATGAPGHPRWANTPGPVGTGLAGSSSLIPDPEGLARAGQEGPGKAGAGDKLRGRQGAGGHGNGGKWPETGPGQLHLVAERAKIDQKSADADPRLANGQRSNGAPAAPA